MPPGTSQSTDGLPSLPVGWVLPLPMPFPCVEVSHLMPQVEDKFEEMIKFDNQLSLNRIAFLKIM